MQLHFPAQIWTQHFELVWHTEATQAGWINDYLIHLSTEHKAHLSRCKADMEEGVGAAGYTLT